ncbi:carcinoembryonic antigen-related cell adhesion molecule 5-like [Hippocampus comes]|uniref:carcinoembryonic antigen-related cell adhesion molecule 5-like n=1 Tax=Hippocampus comes TaxID=109280 RepID=UPI00094E0060|nr:PREDICTED: carcinoembryonic antigen-related cell adhesion molecule 5-like [Hippocampus comes]XP_019751604.1 PREDICTED: carcinoembryonic antigen-related cell adhesion molecule 5-like [Hippocampus comes]XP_019751605.1 PREDICTED: carcinoembryonic antigen-related cell adhesion molecule 5-like [Hippocampus comes]XP_019751606.1 PREDICTED: carcinoembryonic antigen-related cell adhesion molecule 5-like [Hippocampus comes]
MTRLLLLPLPLLLAALSGCSRAAGVLPDSLVAIAGETVTFATTVTPPATPFLVVTWSVTDVHGTLKNIITSTSVNETMQEYRDRITLFRHTGSLELRNVSLRDAGDFTVTVIPAGGAQQRGNCKLDVHERITGVVLIPSATDLLESNNPVTMSCSTAAGSGLSFLWLNGSSEIKAGGRVRITDGGSKLTLTRVIRYDQRPFRCHVFNVISNGTSEPVNLFISYGPENIRLTTSPSLEYHMEGSNINLSCSAGSRPPAVFLWFLNGGPLPASGPELRLRNALDSQSGSYRCEAFNNKTTKSKTRRSTVTILAPVSRVEVKTNATEMFEFSGPVHLSCSSTGTSPSFRWLNGSSEVTESERVQITGGGSKLTVLNVTRYDLGPFRCHVFNLISNGTSGPVVLSVHFGPENMNLTSSPSQENYDEGSDVSLICSVASGPPPQLRWFRNGDLLSHAGSELKLLNIHFHQSGNYSCQAFNDKTMRNVTSEPVAISVKRSEISNVVIAASSTDVEELSGSVRLSCSSAGSFPTFVWRNGSAELAAGDGVHIDGKGAVVTILNVSRYDEGPYTCHVFNNFSNATSRPLKLSISYGPESIHLKQFPPGEYFARGSNISLSCSAACRPSARFEWFLNGESLSRTGPNLNLVNVLENQSGNYSCRAVNIKTAKSQMTKPSAIFIQSPVSNVGLTSNLTVMFEFSSVTMSCSSGGSGLSFRWLNGSLEVTASHRVHLTAGGSTLTVVNVTRYDQGPFSCNVSNGVSEALSRPLHLFIQYGPDSLTIEGPDSVYIGRHAMLLCSASSVPTASFSWLFNGKPTGVRTATYVVVASRSSDAGEYVCTARNAVTGQSATGSHKLSVLALPECDCWAAIGVAAAIAVGCCILSVILIGLIVYGLRRRKRHSSKYPTLKRGRKSVKVKHSDMYRISNRTQIDH